MVASRKRKRDDDDGDDDATYGLRQTLPVANLPIDFDSEPTDGLQYLFTVRRDARRLPNIKHVDNPYTLCPPRPEPTQNVEAPSSLPSKEWRSKFEHRFRNFRGNISQPTIRPQQAGPFQKMIPDKKNRDAWWAFLEGASESVWNAPRQTKHGNERRGQWHGATHQPPSVTPLNRDATKKPRELSPTKLFQLDHRFSLQLVMYFTHWFNLYLQSLDANSNNDNKTTSTYTPTDIHMRWVFALLTRIDLFCSADEIACLRSLARACLALISVVRRRKVGSPQSSARNEQVDRTTETETSGAETHMTPPDSGGDHKSLSESSMWFVFCAVTSTWGQRDLWDDADEALRRNLP